MIDLDDIDTDEDGALTATVELPGGRRVTVEYEFDEEFDYSDDDDDDDDDGEDDVELVEREDLPDLDTMQETVKHSLARLTEEILEAREREVVEELTEAAYEDDADEVDMAEALSALKDDITLDGVIVFGDGGLTLLYIAPEEYPDLIIYCLLDDDLEIDDLMVE
ncbi:hypothetical protein PQI51_05755 [Microbacterium esteraromaticum]|uniref:hypothetical protein n=1 Tax=Microbacterium esteraromaticum TaxID=57043 RepID=UPI0030B5EE6C